MGAGLKRVLIANRGEIAVRIVRACRELGIEAVAAYEPAERGALHVEVADGAVEVAGYLDAEALVAAATAAGADAVHPGYGFLAESPEFAEAVAKAGLVFVGPPPSALRAAGDKIEARRLAEAAGIPVTPGYAGVDLSDETLEQEALRLGFPLMVKAAAGGGGRGMRTVLAAPALPDAIAAARREAAAAFGDGRVYLERLVGDARHVEVQVLADAHGAVVHLGERDCSLQRRHQKIVEEAPSPAADPGLRAALGRAAVALARAAGYVGAGTVEFLLGPDGAWHFLELNARLQVEHAVTEAVTGIDLVRAQLAVAAGEPLELEQEDVDWNGHAIECRLYAEDPANGFLPAAGRLLELDLPRWPGVRIDTGVRAGDEVGVRYDPMLAKVIAHAEDRDACIDRMAAVLRRDRGTGRRHQPRDSCAGRCGSRRFGRARRGPTSSSGSGAPTRCRSCRRTSAARPSRSCTPTAAPGSSSARRSSRCARPAASSCTRAGSSRSAAMTSRPRRARSGRAARWPRPCPARSFASTSTRASTSTTARRSSCSRR